MADVLISPLGRSPGAVSGVYFALQEKGFDIKQVVTVGTSHSDVRKAANNYLKPLFEYEDVGLEYDPIHIPAYELRHTRGSINPYIAMLELALDNAHKGNHRVHVAVTGGRSGMGALAALATNLYGTDHLWHLWVDRKIEEGGTVDKLTGLFDPAVMIKSPFLNPTVKGDDAYEIVELPFLDLRPLHDVLWTYKRTGEVPDPSSPLAQILIQLGLKRSQGVFPAGIPFAQADQILDLITRYTQANVQEQIEILDTLGKILQESGVVESAEYQRLVDLVNGQAPPEALFDFAQQVRKDRKGFWKWFLANKDRIVTVGRGDLDIANTLLRGLALYLEDSGYPQQTTTLSHIGRWAASALKQRWIVLRQTEETDPEQATPPARINISDPVEGDIQQVELLQHNLATKYGANEVKRIYDLIEQKRELIYEWEVAKICAEQEYNRQRITLAALKLRRKEIDEKMSNTLTEIKQHLYELDLQLETEMMN